MNLYSLCFFFVIYAFLGWCCEVIYAALETGQFVNRGFLAGPVCPVYGFGMLLVLAVLTPFSGSLITLFIGSFALTTAIEYLTGYLLERIFHDKWWDYTNEHFNLHGYVCLKFSILWGLACTFVIKCVHPPVSGAVALLPRPVGYALLGIAAALFTVDLCMTALTVLKLRRRIALIQTITDELRRISDTIGEGLYDGTRIGLESADHLRAEADRLRERLTVLRDGLTFGGRRLLGAFPNLRQRYDGITAYTKQIATKIKNITKK